MAWDFGAPLRTVGAFERDGWWDATKINTEITEDTENTEVSEVGGFGLVRCTFIMVPFVFGADPTKGEEGKLDLEFPVFAGSSCPG